MNAVLNYFLTSNGYYNIDTEELNLQSEMHPDYPSFKSVVDTISYFDIENVAVKMPHDQLSRLPKTFLSIIIKEEEEILVAVKKTKKKIQVFYRDKASLHTTEEFLKIWVPKVILVENKLQGASFLTGWEWSIPFLLLAVTRIFSFQNSELAFIFLIFLTIGTVFSILALKEEMGDHSKGVNKFCQAIANSNCTKVIQGSNTKIFGLSLAETALSFFLSTTVFILFFGIQNSLLIPALIAIPIVLYAFYLQAFKLNQFCALCGFIGLSTLGFSLVSIIHLTPDFYWQSITRLILIGLGITLFIHKGKTIISGRIQTFAENEKLKYFKRKPGVIQFLHHESNSVSIPSTSDTSIMLGNNSDSLQVISLTNPFCSHCQEAFLAYQKVLATLENVQIRMLFLIHPEKINHKDTKIVFSLMNIYNIQGKEAFINAYAAWFKDKNIKRWLTHYGYPKDNQHFKEELLRIYQWATSQGIRHTPITIVNSKFYPKNFTYADLPNYLRALSDIPTPPNNISR